MTASRVLLTLGVGLLAVLLGGSSCPFNPNGQGCRTNVECGPYKECDTGSGQCKCTENRGCGQGEFCNAVQQCQIIAGCSDNGDCDQQGNNLLCNVKTGRCETAELCYDDSQCKLNQVCDLTVGACITACRDESDCVLGWGCIREPPSAALGTCKANACSTSEQCRAGYTCDLITTTCVEDRRGPFCGACQFFDPSNPQCGDPANYCLIDTGDATGQGHYCGVDCFKSQACPSGYSCEDVIIVGLAGTEQCNVETCDNGHCTINSGASCTRNEDCPVGAPAGDCSRGKQGFCAGTTDQECRTDTDCGGSEGSCKLATCSGGENSAIGFCSCVLDVDCPQDTCRGADMSDPGNPVTGHCFLSGHECYEDPDCSVIACVNGGCLIGKNCAPSGERRCIELGE